MNKNTSNKKKSALIFLLIPVILVLVVAFNYGKGILRKKNAEKNILAYVEKTYGNRLDKFEYVVGDTVSINGMSSKVTAYHLSFYEQKYWGGAFEIKADLDGNIIYDGYKNWYLNGGTLIEHYNTLYMDTEYTLKKPMYAKAIEDNICSMTDILGVSANIRYIDETADGEYGSVLVEPRLDPNKEYSVDELAKDYGETFITLQSDSSTKDDFIKFANFSAEYFKNSDWKYKNIVVCLIPTNDDNIRYRAVSLTADEIASEDIEQIINQNAFDYTKDDLIKDTQLVNDGNDWPEAFRYAFICGLNR